MPGTTHDEHRVRDRFVAFAFAAADAVLEVADDGKIVYAAGAIESLTRRQPESLIGVALVQLFAAPDRKRAKDLLAALGPGGRLSPAWLHLASGREVMLGACRLPEEASTSIFATLTLNLSRPSAVQAHEHDRASGALTGSAFAAALGERMANGADGDELALLDLGDLDKVLATADADHRRQLLTTIGEVLQQAAGDDGLAGRLDDGRFGVLGTRPIDERKLAKRLTGAARKVAPEANPISVKAVTLALETSGLSRADASRAVIYAVNRFSQGDLSVDGIAALGVGLPALFAHAAEAVGRLRDTIHERRIAIAVQPIVTLETGEVHHYEMLCRMPDGSRPGPVIAAAELAGLAPEFDLMVAEQTFGALAIESRPRDVRVAINLSGRSIESPDFVHALESLLDRRKGRAADVLFEITETASIGNLTRATELARQLRARGHPICIDDLGAGANSFQYLGAFAVDFAKIDGRYVRNAATDHRDKAFLVAMIGLCRNLGVPVIAESIETQDQAKASQALGVMLGQGYHFGKPVPIRDVLDA